MDVALLMTALHAGATIVGTEVVKEITKDAYKSLKSGVARLFGTRASTALDRLEGSPADDAAANAVKGIVGSATDEELQGLKDQINALLTALKSDEQAKQLILSIAKIKVDVEAGGNVILEDIRGARDIDVKAKSGDDFVMKNIAMDSGNPRGN
jgi:hypothetical protein